MTTWFPQVSEQSQTLSRLSLERDINILVILPQESTASAAIFGKRGGYSHTILADPEGSLIEPVNLQLLPAHIFLDGEGKIKHVKSGLLDDTEIRNLLN